MTAASQPSANAIDRISKSVKYTEAQSLDMGGHGNSHTQREFSFWAMLTGKSIDGFRCSWVRAFPKDKNGIIEPDEWELDGNVVGEENAFEASNRIVANGTVVRLFLVGYDPNGVPQYSFIAPGGDFLQNPLPIHDHRDNYHGGFAFSVYHPGTNLPQQQWGA